MFVSYVYDPQAARAYGIFQDQILIGIHSGSRGQGHQIGTDYQSALKAASAKYDIPIRDRDLASAPIDSEEGRRYLAALIINPTPQPFI